MNFALSSVVIPKLLPSVQSVIARTYTASRTLSVPWTAERQKYGEDVFLKHILEIHVFVSFFELLMLHISRVRVTSRTLSAFMQAEYYKFILPHINKKNNRFGASGQKTAQAVTDRRNSKRQTVEVCLSGVYFFDILHGQRDVCSCIVRLTALI